MMVRFVLVLVCAASSGFASIRAERILRIPSQAQQTLVSLAAGPSGNLVATGRNANGAFVDKLDASGNVVFTYSNWGSVPAGVAVAARCL